MPRGGRPLTPQNQAKLVAGARAWRAKHRPLEVRFWEKVEKHGPDECWPWLGAQAGKSPRGALWEGGKVIYAHRIALQLAGVEIPAGLVVDHLCKNGLCMNPAHMRVTTQKINSTENSDSPMAKNSRKTHCVRGHPLSGDNIRIEHKPTRYTRNGRRIGRCTTRVCLACRAERQRERIAKMRNR